MNLLICCYWFLKLPDICIYFVVAFFIFLKKDYFCTIYVIMLCFWAVDGCDVWFSIFVNSNLEDANDNWFGIPAVLLLDM